MNLKKSVFFILLVVVIDQVVKVYIKTNFALHDEVEVFNWFKILFIENEGAAWGYRISDFLPISADSGKLILTIFRLFAVFAIGYWLYDCIEKKSPKILIISICLIFAGAIGNIIDSVFYGLIFDHSNGQIATLFSKNPYGSLFYGKVVDMLYFPLIDTVWPEWMPWVGGNRFRFFQPIFNIADSAISIGVALLLLFSKKAFPKENDQETEKM